MHADRANRVALIAFGLLVLAAGAAGMTASVGGFGFGRFSDSHAPTRSTAGISRVLLISHSPPKRRSWRSR